MPGPKDISSFTGPAPRTLSFIGQARGLFNYAKALGLGTHFGAKAPGCPGGMETSQTDTCITFVGSGYMTPCRKSLFRLKAVLIIEW